MTRYELRIWEKAEHWFFYESFEAASIEEAVTKARKAYPTRSYIVYAR